MIRLILSPHKAKALILSLGYCLAILFLAGCVATPEGKLESSDPVFYPPLPNPPRIQYLTTFSSSNDVSRAKSDFASFLVGEEDDNNYITKPYGVQMHGGKIYVVDSGAAGYVILDLVNQKFDVIRDHGGGQIKKAINISIDTDGSKYITDTQRNQVLIFDKNERFVRAFGVKGQFRPVDTAISGDKLFVADVQDHEIEVLDKHSGALLYSFGKAGSAEDQFYHPTNIAIGPDNHLYISDTSNFRIQKFTMEGQYVRSFGSIGVNLGQFSRPKGIALDREGNFYAVDAGFENVQLFNPEGDLMMFFGAPGGLPDSINLPADIEIDYDHVALFEGYAHPDFKLEYIIFVTSQFGRNKVNVYGFGKMKDMEYDVPLADTSN